MKRTLWAGLIGAGLLFLPFPANAAVLEVGVSNGATKVYSTIQQAVAAAKKGDEISVFPVKKSTFYDKTAVMVKTPGLFIHAADPRTPIKIDGAGFDYSGEGRIPRAIFQFNPGADGCTLEGFELTGAHNRSHNGAGVRINAANDITIRHCIIRGNDMGIMSNGQVKNQTGARQLIEFCLIEKNGDFKDPGYNHNLYLGGTSVTVRGCEIAYSLTGHNLKSRAHQNWIEYNFIHDSANRELDLVDGEGNTDVPGSDTVLLGNIITKAAGMKGNKAVIQFGKDGKADHTGTLWLVHNTITTPYISPVVDLSAPGASCILLDNIFVGSGRAKIILLAARAGAKDAPKKKVGNEFQKDPGDKPTDGPVIAWEKLNLPWEAFGKNPESPMRYVAERRIELLPAAERNEPGAGEQKK